MARPENRLHKEETTLYKEEQAFKLRVKGWAQHRIAKHLKMTQQGVSKALKRSTARFSKAYLDDVKQTKDEQVAQLENVAHEAISAWYKSKETHKSKRTKMKGAKEGVRTAEKVDSESDQYGDPRFLAEFRKAKEDIRKIIGADLITNDTNKDESRVNKFEIQIIDPKGYLKEDGEPPCTA